jgi:hypothetical protein
LMGVDRFVQKVIVATDMLVLFASSKCETSLVSCFLAKLAQFVWR